MTNTQLGKIQSAGLRRTVTHAFETVTFYKELFEADRVPIDDIAKVGDISKLPLISRMDLRKASLQNRTASDADVNSCIVNTTSGTSGMPVSILEDPYSAAYREALMLRFLWAYGVRPFDRIARGRYVSTPIPHLAATSGLWGFIRRRKMQSKLFVDFNDQLEFLAQSKPDVLIAATSYCRGLAKHCQTIGKSPSFRIVITGGEMLDDPTRKLIAETFQANVFDHYGIEEVGGSIAWECPSHYGYHINAEALVLEFLRNGEPVSAGESGEMYVTCFHRKATPIIRYGTGDVARRVDGDCPCGRGLPMLSDIQGRILDYILTGNGRHVSPHMILSLFSAIVSLRQFKVTQRKDLSVDVRLIVDNDESERVLQDVQRGCRALFSELPLDVKLVDRIDASGPKFRVVESQASS